MTDNAQGERRVRVKPSLAADASPEAYGEAMSRCMGYAPSCSDAEECAYDGFCFTRDGAGLKTARKRLDKLIQGEDDITVRSWLRHAADALDHYEFSAFRVSDALRLSEINRRVRAEYLGGRFANSRGRDG